MTNSFFLVFLLGGFCLGVSALKCFVCDGNACTPACTKQKEQECDKKHDRCLDVAYYSHSLFPTKTHQPAWILRAAQVQKLCANEKIEEHMCIKAKKKRHLGSCESCKGDGCNKGNRTEIIDRLLIPKK